MTNNISDLEINNVNKKTSSSYVYVYYNNKMIGLIQSILSPDIEIIKNGKMEVVRFVIYDSSLGDILNIENNNEEYKLCLNPFKILKDEKIPFEIKIKIINSDNVIKTYLNCYILGYSTIISSKSITIAEQVIIKCD